MLNKWVYIMLSLMVAGTCQASVVQSITNQEVFGEDMLGLLIKITFDDDGSEVEFTWDGSNGGLEFDRPRDDTIVGFWIFTNVGTSAIRKLELDAFGADAVFDFFTADDGEIVNGVGSTPGSGRGKFDIDKDSSGNDVGSMFIGPVSVGIAPAVGDIFRGLEIDFSDNPLAVGAFIEFDADTDKVLLPVPLPPALLFFTSGLFVLLSFTNRKRYALGNRN